jgi:Spy/CpxP family protein refolding chaperone
MRLSLLLSAAALPLLLALPAVAPAQQSGTSAGASAGAMSPEQMQGAVKSALKSVNLTPRQKLQIKPMIQTYQTQTAGADAATTKAAKEQLLKGIYGVLTPQQQSEFQASLKASIQNAKAGGASQ